MNAKRISLTVLALVLVVAVTRSWIPEVQAKNGEENRAAKKTAPLAYHDAWRKLWEDHIVWTRSVILGVLDELPGLPQYAERLLQNPRDMADALRPFYGDAAADEFEVLVTEHLTIAVELLEAAKGGDMFAFDDANARWYDNAGQIAALMARLNPKFWPLAEAEAMWEEHLDATLAEAVAHLTGDFAGEVDAYDEVHDLALEMADFFSNGVMRQFPREFSGQLGK